MNDKDRINELNKEISKLMGSYKIVDKHTSAMVGKLPKEQKDTYNRIRRKINKGMATQNTDKVHEAIAELQNIVANASRNTRKGT